MIRNRAPIWPHCVRAQAVLLAGVLGFASLVNAQDDARLLDREPFDQIYFKQPPDRVIKVLPLNFPSRRVPSNPPPDEKLIVRPWDTPDEPMEIPWRLIERVELFEQLVLAEANALTVAGRFGEAYDYHEHLRLRYPNVAGRLASYQRFLYADAKSALDKDQHALALASLFELHDRNPQFEGLTEALTDATQRQLTALAASDRYVVARQFCDSLIERLGSNPTNTALAERLGTIGSDLFERARQSYEAGHVRETYRQLRWMLDLLPDNEQARQLLLQLHEQHPSIVIGVSAPAPQTPGDFLHDSSSRRVGRILDPPFFDLVGFGPQGATYESSLVKVEQRDFGAALSFTIPKDRNNNPGGLPLTGYSLSRHLRELTDPESSRFDADWTEIFGEIAVHDMFRVDVALRRNHVLPAALLRNSFSWTDPRAKTDEGSFNGPYKIVSRSSDEVVYERSSAKNSIAPTAPHIIVERDFADSDMAVQALEGGKISMLARVEPRHLDRLNENDRIIIDTYAAPTVHCLIPTRRHPILMRPALRRALVYAIPRQQILEKVLLREHDLSGCRVISGPFASGYAYDDQLEPRPYDPRLAMALAEVARIEWLRSGVKSRQADKEESRAAERDAASPPEIEGMRFVIGHPASPLAASACEAISTALQRVGIQTTSEEYESYGPELAERFDLVYVELAMWEPLVDARGFLNRDTFVGHLSSYLELALSGLDGANDWRKVREQLVLIHRLVHQDVTVIPLWQFQDRFAYHHSLENVSRQPVTLYENVDEWTSTLPLLWKVP